MEYKSSYDRIDNFRDIDFISKNICKDYNFGNFLKSELIETGYEDFNYFLYTDDNKYVVKVFNTERDDSSCERLIDILIKSYENGVPVPKIYKYKDKYIYEVIKNNIALKLFVMEYVGKDFWSFDKILDYHDLDEVAKIASTINSIDYDIKETFYDEWTITNLNEEYEKKKKYIEAEDLEKIEEIIETIKNIDWNKFKKCYIHGDLIKANIIKNKKGELYYIDFSAFNYLPRIIECIVILLGDCLTNSKKDTINNMKTFIKAYNKFNPLDKNELDNLALLLKSLAAMYIIQASYIKNYLHGDYIENEYWLSQGRKFLAMDISNNDLLGGEKNKH